jgi:RES domain-containing protein
MDSNSVARLAMSTARPLDGELSFAGPSADHLAPESLITTKANRWSADGEPTIYLASDDGVALAELARHLSSDNVPARAWGVGVSLAAVVDLSNDAAGPPTWVLNHQRCREIARAIREAGDVEAIVVPSVPFLDDPSRWNLVIFVERLRKPVSLVVAPLKPTLDLTPSTDVEHG